MSPILENPTGRRGEIAVDCTMKMQGDDGKHMRIVYDFKCETPLQVEALCEAIIDSAYHTANQLEEDHPHPGSLPKPPRKPNPYAH